MKEPPAFVPNNVDPRRANVARVYDYLLGGKDNYAADREAGEKMKQVNPDAVTFVKENRRYMQRAAYYVAHQGVKRFIDLGTGLPTAGPLHEVVQEVHLDAHTIYVDNDEVVLSHARALMAQDAQTLVIGGDLTEPGGILADRDVAAILAGGEPVGVLMLAILHFLSDEQATTAVQAFMNAMPSGSYLVISHGTADHRDPDSVRKTVRTYSDNIQQGYVRSAAALERLVEGMDIIEPGVVPLPQWPNGGEMIGSGWALGLVACKP